MKKIFTLFAVALALVSCSGNKTVLFGGPEGWSAFLKDDVKNTGTFAVKDKVLEISGYPFGYIRTNEKYSDYKLHLEWRWSGGKAVDGGIYVHLQDGDGVWPTGMQCQMAPDALGALMGGKMSGAEQHGPGFFIKSVFNDKIVENPVGEWNTTDIECTGTHIRVTINGELVNETDCELSGGYIGMQSEGAPLQFRNVYLVK